MCVILHLNFICFNQVNTWLGYKKSWSRLMVAIAWIGCVGLAPRHSAAVAELLTKYLRQCIGNAGFIVPRVKVYYRPNGGSMRRPNNTG